MAVGDNCVVRRIPSSEGCGKRDGHVTFEGRALEKSDEMKACGIREESMMHFSRRVCGGGAHKNKQPHKQVTPTPQAQEREVPSEMEGHSVKVFIDDMLGREEVCGVCTRCSG